MQLYGNMLKQLPNRQKEGDRKKILLVKYNE